jgi:hypothetical protein
VKKVSNIELNTEDKKLEMLRCPCGAWASLSLEPLQVVCEGVFISGPMPSLSCPRCASIRLPLPLKLGLQGMAQMAKKTGKARVTVDVPKAVAAKPSFALCKGVTFSYDRVDQQYIPGLSHTDDGFLTPVFFSKDILTYFYNHPDYAVTFASDTYGTIYTKDRYISFGLNENGKLVMWLGDLSHLEQRDQVMFLAHNVPSDHSVGCEFYEGQIEAVFTELSQEQRLIRTSGKFAIAVIERFSRMKIYKMDAEAAGLLTQIRRPVHFTEKEFGDAMETMTKLFIERIDIAPMKAMLREKLGKSDLDRLGNLRELKTLQLWAEKIVGVNEADNVMSPLFILYDLRVAYKHLLPLENTEEIKMSCRTRLDQREDAGLDQIYTVLTHRLEQTFVTLEKAVLSMKSEGQSSKMGATHQK